MMNPLSPSTRRASLRRRLAGVVALGLALTGIAGLPLLSGCGGGSKSAGVGQTGRATLTITWPDRAADSRLIPVAANSITATFRQNGQVVATQTVARPSSGNQTTVIFSALPPGDLTFQATAYPNADGSGVAQASAATGVTIVSGQDSPVSVTMASTIDHLTVTPASPTVLVGATTALSVTPVDAGGNIVLTNASTISWVSLTPSIATVSSTGVVTGVAAGTAQIQVTETESGKSLTVNVTVTTPAATTVVDLANAYINSLSATQRTATVVSNTAANAAKWSNLPATPTPTTGTNSLRSGVAYSALNTTQKAAWDALVQAVLTLNTTSKPLDQFNQNRAAENYLATFSSGYNGNYVYVAFVGTPSATDSWLLQIGGHHIAHNYYFIGTTLQTTTPYFLGVEPQTFTLSGTTYTPLAAQRNGMFNLINSFNATQLTAAKLSASFNDVLLGPGQDARSLFPTGATGRGILAASLTTAQKDLLKTAIAAWTQDSVKASTYQALYESELDQTYVAYSGTTAFTTQGDYVRIDGPHVWIEFVCQNGVVFPAQIHFHTIWRDRVTDYNASYGF